MTSCHELFLLPSPVWPPSGVVDIAYVIDLFRTPTVH